MWLYLSVLTADEVCEVGTEYKCVNGSSLWGTSLTSCIPSSWSCDRERDCSDASDEKNCASDCNPNPCKYVSYRLCDHKLRSVSSYCQLQALGSNQHGVLKVKKIVEFNGLSLGHS